MDSVVKSGEASDETSFSCEDCNLQTNESTRFFSTSPKSDFTESDLQESEFYF